MNVAVFGGSFDPPHVGHVLAATWVALTAGVERVLVVPVYAHAFGKAKTPFEHRLEMTRFAMRDLRPAEVSTIEATLPTPSRTLATLTALRAAHPDWSLRLVVGTDVLAEKDQWHAFDEIMAVAPPIVLGRRGAPDGVGPRPLFPEVSSTELRERLARRTGPARDDALLADLVPRAVLEYIDAHGLYR